MPLIQVQTSCDLSDSDMRQSVALRLSKLAAEGIGKPEQYVMASVQDNVTMTMSGTAGACALVTIKSIGGLSKAVNQALTDQISQTLREELAIPLDRIYLTFEELLPSHWGFNGRTFG